MEITSITNPTATAAAGSGSVSQNNADSLKTEFLTLLIAQLQNQDPLNPTDASEFTAQLATFSQLEQSIRTNQLLSEQASLQTSILATSAASFIGKVAEVAGDGLTVSGGSVPTATFSLPVPAADTTVKIRDEDGNLVRTIDIGSSPLGSRSFVWDGLDAAGQPVADGDYRMEVVATTQDGTEIPVDVSTHGLVKGVRFLNGIVLLSINGREYTLGELLGLRESGGSAPTEPTPAPAPPGEEDITEDQPAG